MIIFDQLGKYGRFANGLYQIASTIGIATKSGQPYAFPKWVNHDHAERFGSKEDCDLQKHFVNPLPEIPEGLAFQDLHVQWGFHQTVLPSGNYNLIGHLQSPKYFEHCMGLVRHYFTMKDEYPENDFCAIHYRAGDYQEGENVYHPRMTIEYYRAAMNHFPADQKFMVFSDDKEAAVQLLNETGRAITVSEGHDYIEDFKAMKSCRHFIIANSSYSAMAAELAYQPDKKVIAPKKWFGPIAGINGDDIYNSNWIVI